MAINLTDAALVEALSGSIPLAVSYAEAGFHFEEGGCWGFAAALFDLFTAAGTPCEIQYRGTGFVHAVAAALDLHWDHQGAGAVGQGFEAVSSVEALERLAVTFGIPLEEFEADREAARGILSNAAELCSQAA